mmetsp:Transcript_115556/g.172672  ORF Transcript_115556/g.172672 Transcript_115556/m.172672 type:complete len:247 (-) Transcript_115556:328-1068(-)
MRNGLQVIVELLLISVILHVVMLMLLLLRGRHHLMGMLLLVLLHVRRRHYRHSRNHYAVFVEYHCRVQLHGLSIKVHHLLRLVSHGLLRVVAAHSTVHLRWEDLSHIRMLSHGGMMSHVEGVLHHSLLRVRGTLLLLLLPLLGCLRSSGWLLLLGRHRLLLRHGLRRISRRLVITRDNGCVGSRGWGRRCRCGFFLFNNGGSRLFGFFGCGTRSFSIVLRRIYVFLRFVPVLRGGNLFPDVGRTLA